MRPEHWLFTIPLRLRSLFRWAQADQELDDELRDHLQRKTEECVAEGMTREEAHRRARLDLGGIEQTKEKCRDARRVNWIKDLIQDLRYGLRMLRKSPGFTAVAVLTLALGIGANSAVFSILDAVLIRALPYPHPERLVKVDTYNLKSGDFYSKTSYPDFSDWSRQNHFFDKLAAYEEKTFNLAGILQPEHIKGEVVSPDFFETLGIQPYRGRSLAGAHNQQAVVLSYPLWSRSFASDPGTIGRSVTLDGYSYEVIGVMPPGFQFPDPQTELWVAISAIRPDLREEVVARGNAEMSVIGRLDANVSLSQAQAGMTVIASGLARKYPASNRDLGVRLVPLQEDMVGKFRPPLLILMGSAGLVLLIACANIGTLLLSRATARQSEIGIRSSLGATRARIITQLLIENLLLAVVGGTVGVFGAFLLLHVLLIWVPKDIPRISSAHIDLVVLVFTWLISLFAGILFGFAPA